MAIDSPRQGTTRGTLRSSLRGSDRPKMYPSKSLKRGTTLILTVSLEPTPEQATVLFKELTTYNAARQFVSDTAYAQREGRKVVLSDSIRESLVSVYGLTARRALELIANVSNRYRRDRRQHLLFAAHDPIPLTPQSWSFKYGDSKLLVSLAVGRSRMVIPYYKEVFQPSPLEEGTNQSISVGSSQLAYDPVNVSFLLYIGLAPNAHPHLRADAP